MTYREQLNLDKLKLQLADWRTSHGPPQPIPREIWERAVQMAARHGVGVVARTLRLDHGALKKKVGHFAAQPAVQPPTPTTFLELMPPPTTIVGRCVMEVESTQGHEVRLKLHGVAASALGTIIREVLA